MADQGLRMLLLRLHRWIGLQMIILFMILFSSGILLLYSDEISALFAPRSWVSAPPEGTAASFGKTYDSVKSAYPDATIYVLQKQPQPWLADRNYVTTGSGRSIVVWTDPASGAVLDETPDRDIRTLIRKLHDSLLLPGRKGGRLGFIAVSATGFLLLYSVISGLIVYRRFWKGFFRLPPRDQGARLYQAGLHRLLGLWSSLFLFIIGATAIVFFFNGLGFNGRVPKESPAIERSALLPAGFDGAQLDAATAAARSARPGFTPLVAVMPRKNTAGIAFEGFDAGAGALAGLTRVSIDPSNMQLLGIIPPDRHSAMARLKEISSVLHFGDFGGLWARLLWTLFGMAGLWLLWSGARVYIARAEHLPGAQVQGGALRQFFHGLGILRWLQIGLIPLLLVLVAMAL